MATHDSIIMKRLTKVNKEILDVIWGLPSECDVEWVSEIHQNLVAVHNTIGDFYKFHCPKYEMTDENMYFLQHDGVRDMRPDTSVIKELNNEYDEMSMLSFHDCDDIILAWLTLYGFHAWNIAISNGIPVKYYEQILDLSLDDFQDGYSSGKTWMSNPFNDNMLIFIKLREVMSWEKIGEYFGLT